MNQNFDNQSQNSRTFVPQTKSNYNFDGEQVEATISTNPAELKNLYLKKLAELKKLEARMKSQNQIPETPIRKRGQNSVFKQSTSTNYLGQASPVSIAAPIDNAASRGSLAGMTSGRSNSSRYFQPSQSQNQIDQSKLQQQMQGDQQHFMMGLGSSFKGNEDLPFHFQEQTRFNQQLIKEEVDNKNYDNIQDKLMIGQSVQPEPENKQIAEKEKLAYK